MFSLIRFSRELGMFLLLGLFALYAKSQELGPYMSVPQVSAPQSVDPLITLLQSLGMPSAFIAVGTMLWLNARSQVQRLCEEGRELQRNLSRISDSVEEVAKNGVTINLVEKHGDTDVFVKRVK